MYDRATDPAASSIPLYLVAEAEAEAEPGARADIHAPSGVPTLSNEKGMQKDLEKDKVLPLPGWLVRVYFIFPVILYIPDAIFNYYVYSDGGTAQHANPLIQTGFVLLWGFLAIGVVGMAYLLSVLAPWHWGQGHHVQAFFCAVGVLIATAITTWCSLAFRSQDFKAFPTDEWVYSLWPQLRASNFSLTMLLVAMAPPFWGLFWAVVQPTTRRRSLAQMQMSHEERLLRTQQDAELKQIKAETGAKVREAQLRGMAATAVTARQQFASQFRSASSPRAVRPGQPQPVDEALPVSYPESAPMTHKASQPPIDPRDPSVDQLDRENPAIPEGEAVPPIQPLLPQEGPSYVTSPAQDLAGARTRAEAAKRRAANGTKR